MGINFSASELKVTLVPIGKKPGRKSKSAIVYREYGDIKARLVQTIANMVGGEVIYIESVVVSGRSRTARQTIPVSGWSFCADSLGTVTDFIDKAYNCGMAVDCFGASRDKWTIQIDTMSESKDAIDNMTDKGLAGDGKAIEKEIVEANGIRARF